MEQFNSGELNFIFEIIPHKYSIGLMSVGNLCLAAGGGSKRRSQYCSDNSGTILYLRALQGHSGRNLIDPMLQDNVIIQRGLFIPSHLPLWMYIQFSLNHQQWIDTWRSGFEQKTDSILLAH